MLQHTAWEGSALCPGFLRLSRCLLESHRLYLFMHLVPAGTFRRRVPLASRNAEVVPELAT